MNLDYIAKELVVGELFIPPLLFAVICAYGLTSLTMLVSAKVGWDRHIYAPAIVELALTTIYTVLLSLLIFQG
ncbi:DUF1656 domain-containing protein [Neiella sp. HB171785]|uniref:DUF1656 domain-containing protein n=1 Tax=Neiella litorisoli TaxID=2771431 RepID=A0A8J6QQX3_9GAMM|nr:DUF1656 domain-containing protein [Neiella litorisoli]MBD1389134.1 DUF1656 domain-containing protein [Neiella litorisoli]